MSIRMNKKACSEKIIYEICIPLLLLVYPLVKASVGVDYMDSMYSPVNFVFFPQMEGMWVVATFLANVIGFCLTKLPGASTYLGLRIYTNLFISVLALVSYFWLKKKIPAWIAALGEVIAIGFCWCPSTILYNYLTYLFLLLGIVCLYEGLQKDKNKYLVLAGIFLGCNLFVRFPNVIEAGFILAVWCYGFWKKKKIGKVVQETLWCMLGYFISVLVFMGILILLYGADSYVGMITALFSMTGSATSYQPQEMLLSIIREYVKGLKWPLGMALYTAVTGGVFWLGQKYFSGLYIRFQRILQAGTVLGILVLFRFYYGQGMFNVNYHSYPSIFQWGTCFLILMLVIWTAVLFHKTGEESGKVSAEKKLLCLLLLLVIFITPIGSNNNLFPIMNNMFLLVPMAIYSFVYLCKKSNTCKYAFPVRAMLVAVVAAVLIQSIGFGVTFSFRGAKDGEKRNTKIEKNVILKGMKTNTEKAQAIEELTVYWEEHHDSKEDTVLLFGHIPGVSYFLHAPSAISTSWPDLESYSYSVFENEMKTLKSKVLLKEQKKPVVIVSYGVNAVITNDAAAMDWYAKNMESGEESVDRMLESKKLAYLRDFLADCSYEKSFENQRFVVYELPVERMNRQ